MPVILGTSNIIIDNGITNFTVETVKSLPYIDKDIIGNTSNLFAEPILELVPKMYPPLKSRIFTNNNLTLSNNYVKLCVCGRSHTVILTNNGKVYSCGKNVHGQLGLGYISADAYYVYTEYTSYYVPAPIINPTEVTFFTTNNIIVTDIKCTNFQTFFLTDQGKVYFCGRNLNDTGVSTPTLISGSLNISVISTSDKSLLALTSDGKVYCYGENVHSQFGFEPAHGYVYNLTEVTFFTTNNIIISDIALGGEHSLFLTNTGNVYTCGRNDDYSPLGLGYISSNPARVSTPTLISALNNLIITNIACGYNHAIFLTKTGKVYTCGTNDRGELGRSGDKKIPLQITSVDHLTVSKIYSTGYTFATFLILDNSSVIRYGSHVYGSVESLKISNICTSQYNIRYVTTEGMVYAYMTIDSDIYGALNVGDFNSSSTSIYGSGLYTISYSSFTPSFEPFKCFNNTSIANNEGRWGENNYDAGSGAYNKTLNLVSDYKGDWLVIKLPVSIKLTRFDIIQISTALGRAPKNLRLYGSTNGSSWTLLVDKENATYTNLLYMHTDMTQYPSATNQYYNHYGLVVSTILGTSETTLSFDEFFIYGVEQQTPLSITLNSTNKSLTNITILPSTFYPNSDFNYNLKFPVATYVNNIFTSSNLILQGNYIFNILNSKISKLIPNGGQQNLLKSETLTLITSNPTSNLILNYHLLNPIGDPKGAQWTYNSANPHVYHLGNVGIGTKTPSYPLHVNGNMYVSSTAYTGSGQTTWTTVSDRRIKENIVKASYEKCLDNVKNIELYRFNFKDNVVNTNDYNQLGFIAQEVQSVYPKAVEVNMIKDKTGEIPDLLSLNTTQIDYTLYGAVKELIKKVEFLEQKLEENENSNMMLSDVLDVPIEYSSNIVEPPIYPDDYLIMMLPPHLRMEHMIQNESSSNIAPKPISREEYLRNLMMIPPDLHTVYEAYLRKLMIYPEDPEVSAVPEVSNESTSNIQVVPAVPEISEILNESTSNIISNN